MMRPKKGTMITAAASINVPADYELKQNAENLFNDPDLNMPAEFARLLAPSSAAGFRPQQLERFYLRLPVVSILSICAKK